MTETQSIVTAQIVTRFRGADRHDLCDATEAAIKVGGGFGWVKPPERQVIERYWRGVLVVPERTLFVGRLDGVIAGSAQLVRPPRNNEAQAHAIQMTGAFTAPWARGHGVARAIVEAAITHAKEQGFKILNMDVRATQTVAIRLCERLGFVRWGTHPAYAEIDGKPAVGYYYYLDLTGEGAEQT